MQQQEGLYGKFILKKADGSFIDSKARYIILRYDAQARNSSHARHAILAYARTIHSINPVFAEELIEEMKVEGQKCEELKVNKTLI